MQRILVIGSLNMDFVVRVPRIPAPGETVLGSAFTMIPGGKGANQAVAAGRLVSRHTVSQIGRVGDDAFAQPLLASLSQAHVDPSFVTVAANQATGIAMIPVAASGENAIVVAAGANATLRPEHLDAAEALFASAACALFQLETPLDTVAHGLRLAKRHGALTILDPAPAKPLPAALLSQVDILTPNETEYAMLASPGGEVDLLAQGVKFVVRKVGSQGSMTLSKGGRVTLGVPAFAVPVVDTTAAGDTFNAGLAVALAEGQSLKDALRFASAAAAICVTRPGAQSSAPHRHEVDAFLQSDPPIRPPQQ